MPVHLSGTAQLTANQHFGDSRQKLAAAPMLTRRLQSLHTQAKMMLDMLVETQANQQPQHVETRLPGALTTPKAMCVLHVGSQPRRIDINDSTIDYAIQSSALSTS